MATWPPTSHGWSLPIATEYAKAMSTETTTGPLTAVQVAAAPTPTPAATSAANPRSCRAIVFTTPPPGRGSGARLPGGDRSAFIPG